MTNEMIRLHRVVSGMGHLYSTVSETVHLHRMVSGMGHPHRMTSDMA